MNTFETIQSRRKRCIIALLALRRLIGICRDRLTNLAANRESCPFEFEEAAGQLRKYELNLEAIETNLVAINEIRRAYLAEHLRPAEEFRTTEVLFGLVSEDGDLLGWGCTPDEALEHATDFGTRDLEEEYGPHKIVTFAQEA